MSELAADSEKQEPVLDKAQMITLCVKSKQWALANAAFGLSGESKANSDIGAMWLTTVVESCQGDSGIDSGLLSFLKTALSLGANPLQMIESEASSFRLKKSASSLFRAVARKLLNIANEMISAPGLDKAMALNQLREEGFSCAQACSFGEAGVRFLLALGEDPNSQSNLKMPWAHLCRSSGELQALAEAGADLSAHDSMGRSLEEKIARIEDSKQRPLMMSIAFKKIKESKIKKEVISPSEIRAICLLAAKGSPTELTKSLKSHGVSAASVQDEHGRSLLGIALLSGNWRVIKRLMELGLDPMKLAPSGEPEACYLFARKEKIKSGSVVARQRFEACERLNEKIQWGWRSPKGRSFLEEMALNDGAVDYQVQVRGGALSKSDAYDAALGGWFLMKEPFSKELPLSVALLKIPGLEPLGVKAIKSRPDEPFISDAGDNALTLMAKYFFKNTRDLQHADRDQIVRLATDLVDYSTKTSDEGGSEKENKRLAPKDQIEAALEQAFTVASDGSGSYSGLGALSSAVSQFVAAAASAGWSPDVDRLSPAVIELMKLELSGYGRSHFFEEALNKLVGKSGPKGASLILDGLQSGSKWGGALAERWLKEGKAINQQWEFPDDHPALNGALPEAVALSPIWREVEAMALSQPMVEAKSTGPSLRI